MRHLPTTLGLLGKTQRELARAIGVREETVSRWINGEVAISSDNERSVLAYVRALDPTATLEALYGEGQPAADEPAAAESAS